MGLDCYLSASRYVSAYDDEGKQISAKINELAIAGLNGRAVSSIVTRVAYWRKANQIHNWFVENCQNGEDDCREYDVSCDSLVQLVELCKKVLKNKKLAEKLLPVRGGIFFGSNDYDDYYFQNLKDTISKIEPVLIIPYIDNWDFSYRASW